MFFKNRACYLIGNATPGTCNAAEQAFSFSSLATAAEADAITVSNGNCGQGTYSGLVPRRSQ